VLRGIDRETLLIQGSICRLEFEGSACDTSGKVKLRKFLMNGHRAKRLFIAYYRVSTGRQMESGLGIDAQRSAVHEYVSGSDGRLVAEFSETVSGRKNDRPQLRKALNFCRIIRATLIIARLDRLSRSVEMITRLLESGLDFVATDFPQANKFTIHILAAVAEYEARLQSERMKATMAALKERGVAIGRPREGVIRRFPPGCQQASGQARRARSEARARDLAPLVWRSIAVGKSYRVIADEFNEEGIPPARMAPWTVNAIWRIVRQTANEYGRRSEEASVPRVGAAQKKVSQLLLEIGPLLISWRAEGKAAKWMASELDRRGIKSPWHGAWSSASIRRYLMRALNVTALRTARQAAT
jgi:DNA invertase Pin-like site-specific DNA recombinase